MLLLTHTHTQTSVNRPLLTNLLRGQYTELSLYIHINNFSDNFLFVKGHLPTDLNGPLSERYQAK